jgi:hypothetical protein
MKTDKLNDCLDYIRNWEILNAEDHGNFSTKGPSNGLAFIEPFRKELLENLIDLEHQKQINLINYYIVEIYKSANTDFIRYLYEITIKNENELVEKTRIANIHGEHDHEALEILRFIWWLFIEIDDCCLTYKIPLARLLEDQDIDLHDFFFDPPITMLEMATTFLNQSINKSFVVGILLFFDDYKMTTRLVAM